MKHLLKQYFGYDEFRPLQEEIVNHVVSGKDCFVLMPTGGGKSLCYQLPALKFDGITVVVSPLISLMKDQVDALRACGIKAELINSTLAPMQIDKICLSAKNGEVKILYIAPERFALKDFQEFLKTLTVSLVVVDEAHCISEWGHDFRPSYRNLSLLKELFPSTPLMALTATATRQVREDIINQLQLQKARVFISSFNRENLHIRVIEKKQASPKLVNILQKYRDESVIIYCFSRKETEMVAENLKLKKFNVRAYHAGMDPGERTLVQDLFIKDEVNIIVATIAFGMGIDKPDVRLVVHYTYPKTLEGYYQEIGRAGRDGLASECVMFYTYADTRKHEFFINQIEDEKLRSRAHKKLNLVSNYAKLATCRKKYLLNYFGEELTGTTCRGCDICCPTKNLAGSGASFEAIQAKDELGYNRELFERLRALRRKLAYEANVPPFVVFADTALREMSHYLPLNSEDFSNITGVGAKKLEQYGASFLSIINSFAREKDIAPGDLSRKKHGQSRARKGISGFHLKTKDLLAKKMPIFMIAHYCPSDIPCNSSCSHDWVFSST
ncbi:MAG: ATP-dependent DNA helicase RecQ [Candidatus Saganbacteria bacterium]|uniref:ATP-dependent DNA helicase RecQ n=1 Tax=Candidatus Saganbacteria bacterium TaxID=2575572 RepID=A0A833L1S8_UNCSA|nr:MAG: ATP-dependent DNA helicase RecQ [Candidatus Saganbacteria bacterium]